MSVQLKAKEVRQSNQARSTSQKNSVYRGEDLTARQRDIKGNAKKKYMRERIKFL